MKNTDNSFTISQVDDLAIIEESGKAFNPEILTICKKIARQLK